jgi:hypothetical protein
MKMTLIIMISFLLTILLAPVVAPVASNSNTAFAGFGDCPSCWAWIEIVEGVPPIPDQQIVHLIACMQYQSVLRLYVEIYKWDEEKLIYVYDWQYVLMVLDESENCKPGCYEYTAEYYLPTNWDGFTGDWYVRDEYSHLTLCTFTEYFPNPFE